MIWADSTVNTEDRGYLYDAAWNLNQRTNNGTTTTFAVDVKNQLTSVGGSGCVYDNNGNLTSSSGGSYTYAYDAENRLINWSYVYENTAQTHFVYDGLGRLRKRVEYTWNSTNGWVVSSDTRYVYDGMRVIQERNGANNTPTVSYTRGGDLSGTFEGAGGIGGLLARSHGYSSGSWSGHNFYHADGNGNVTMLIDNAGTPNVTATYRYDPYGNSITATGTNAANNVYRFSSKEFHVNSGMYYYGYRFYDPNVQRWLNRDPLGDGGSLVYAMSSFQPSFEVSGGIPYIETTHLEELEGPNSYAFVGNNPTEYWDGFGTAKGGEQNISVCHKGEVLNKSTPLGKVQSAIREAISDKMSKKHIGKLKGLAKVINRGGGAGFIFGFFGEQLNHLGYGNCGGWGDRGYGT